MPSDDYNRVLLKVDEGRSHESDPDNDYEMSSDDDNEDTAKYINASLISVRPFVVQRCGLVFNRRSLAVAAVILLNAAFMLCKF